MMERTLLNIKPDAVERNLTGEILKRVEAKGYRIVAIDKVWLKKREVEAFYAVHTGKPFFSELVNFISSGPCVPCVIEGENVIQGIRTLIGATDPAKAAEGTVRRDFAESITRNSVHASDGPDTAKEEIAFFFAGRSLVQGGGQDQGVPG
jgi:nucleoside-diphosphate kinase